MKLNEDVRDPKTAERSGHESTAILKSTATSRRVSSPLVSQMLCPLMANILAIISRTGSVVGVSAPNR